MQRIKNKIYEWISSMLNHNMEERRSKLTSGTPKKSLPLTDWKKAFPMLSRYSSNMLLMKQGPIVIGLYFQKVYDDYRPIFISYPLWKDSLKDCMQFYIFHHEFRNNKNLQLNVPILNHQSNFTEAVKCVQSQSSNLLQENVYVKDIFNYLDYLREHDLLIKLQRFDGKRELLVYSMMIALYTNNEDLLQWVCNKTKKQIQTWDKEYFKQCYGYDLETWEAELYQLIDQREEIMERIRINSMDKRIAKLKESHLII